MLKGIDQVISINRAPTMDPIRQKGLEWEKSRIFVKKTLYKKVITWSGV